ncbi:hypothetical protein [Tersicoccus phoenicis]|nr:hypothetical protein [Tersicoccus phoenicis]
MTVIVVDASVLAPRSPMTIRTAIAHVPGWSGPRCGIETIGAV